MKFVPPGDPILSEVMPEFAGDCRTLRATAEKLHAKMKSGNGRQTGIAIAAPQVGLRLRMFVIMGKGGKLSSALVCINPIILQTSELWFRQPEMCLSYPDYKADVERADTILLEYRNLIGARCQITLHGLAARAAQHELDHLNGITIHRGAA